MVVEEGEDFLFFGQEYCVFEGLVIVLFEVLVG